MLITFIGLGDALSERFLMGGNAPRHHSIATGSARISTEELPVKLLDLNPMEHVWSPLKLRMRRQLLS